MYMVTDRGPLRHWLKVICRREDDKCDCGVIQNAVHLLRCPLIDIADGKRRSAEEIWGDPGPEWCRAVAD